MAVFYPGGSPLVPALIPTPGLHSSPRLVVARTTSDYEDGSLTSYFGGVEFEQEKEQKPKLLSSFDLAGVANLIKGKSA